MFSNKREPSNRNAATRPVAKGSTFSIVGADVTIRGDISASADLHVDGSVEGDIACASLVQGESSRITGAISAESARLSGSVAGTVIVRELVILRTARIEGDVRYETLTIEQGAIVNGRFAPDALTSEASGDQARRTEAHLALAS